MEKTDKYTYTETAAMQTVFTRKIMQLSPSVKLVFKILEYKGLLTQKDLVAESYLPARTVRYALSILKKEGILEERLYYKDARQCLYGVRTQQQDELLSNFACGMVWFGAILNMKDLQRFHLPMLPAVLFGIFFSEIPFWLGCQLIP